MLGKYDLVLEWNRADCHTGVVRFWGARFWGPALKIAARISSDDSIRLDFTKQLSPVINGWEVCVLRWVQVIHQNSTEALLSGVSLEFDSLLIPKGFYPGDKILIDTRLHEDEKHRFNLVYPAKVINDGKHAYFGNG